MAFTLVDIHASYSFISRATRQLMSRTNEMEAVLEMFVLLFETGEMNWVHLVGIKLKTSNNILLFQEPCVGGKCNTHAALRECNLHTKPAGKRSAERK